MALNRQAVQDCLRQCDYESFKDLFIDELGWDDVDLIEFPVGIESSPYKAVAVVEKKGVIVYHCQSEMESDIPDRITRRKIEQQINQYTREHLIIYTDSKQQEQIWQWVRREKGKPIVSREYPYRVEQDGESLIQRLESLAIDFEEEGDLSLSGVTKRNKDAFDVEKVTNKFYKQFKREHERFLAFVTGIQERFDQEWYASVMLNRLMFVYFLQKKRFLDGDSNYLQNKLKYCQQGHGDGEFYSFYRYFLLRLFHDGLGDSKQDDPELKQLIGKIPYLNGGLFDVHELEVQNPNIQIPNEAFEAIFEFFGAYNWHLDDRPSKKGNEINPDVLGYIFEKYINQKQMGAYYTKEDITEYISKNTIIPFLLDAAKKGCALAFEPDGPVWRLLKENPERYIYAAVKKGVIKEDPTAKTTEVMALPPEIAVGIEDVAQRGAWNRLADAEYALPTELWREHVARRLRCLEIREKLARGEVHEVNDLITYNLDIRQFVQDVIEQCEGPELLRAFYKAISQISVLDPTCGSGAFLFAALNILEPLYDACLRRMTGFVEDLDRSEEKSRPEKFSDFRKILEQVAKHPNREYFILKSIILGNLYGVDIMEEAVEICKLRLFLKLVSQVAANDQKPNYGLEPLPDIDFNIRAGNTLVGFATYDEVKKVVEGDGQQKLDLFSDMPRIDESAEIAALAFQRFKEQQIDHGMDASKFKDAKVEVRQRLKELNDELNRYLASEYGVDVNKTAFGKWLKHNQPFHWFVEFYGIINGGGFDAIIGNPPYVELKQLKNYKPLGYECERDGNLYALVLERCFSLASPKGKQGFIVPVSSVSTDRYINLQNMLSQRELFYSSFDDRPSILFEGLQHIRLTIHIIGSSTTHRSLKSTRYNKWKSNERKSLFSTLEYAVSNRSLVEQSLPKLSSEVESKIVEKLSKVSSQLSYSYDKGGGSLAFYSRKVGYFLQALSFQPRVLDGQGLKRPPSEFKNLRFANQTYATLALACLNSNLFYWFVTVFSDCRHVNKREVDAFPVDLSQLENHKNANALCETVGELMTDLNANSEERVMKFKHDTLTVQCILPKASKSIVDKIDTLLADYYDFTSEELDFINNYDIKYRMGLDSFDGD